MPLLDSVSLTNPYAVGKAFYEHGFNVLPISLDGNKQSVIPWTEYQQKRFPWDMVSRKFGPYGVALITGKSSGNLGVIDFDEPSLFNRAFITQVGRSIIDKLGIVKTPRPGWHLWFRCECELGKGDPYLAAIEVEEEGKKKKKGLIEYKAQGQYIVSPFNDPRVHSSGKPYEVVQGDPFNPPVLSKGEVETLLGECRKYNSWKPPVKPSVSQHGLSPGRAR